MGDVGYKWEAWIMDGRCRQLTGGVDYGWEMQATDGRCALLLGRLWYQH
ncbi:MAG: hypothetical protein E7J94_18955 [Clostridium sp.]|uniref:Uncharacterized protein n=1 Tax=Faecalicatena contorta TaxID=39482 RepID=A0A174LP94_9FIRM|nr:hypothetical protein [Faecalicatena contorta]MBS6766000.1 hypothetical protein [Clostridium sp.]MDU7709344.1 hypothetical protein [Clostridium sp.]CUP23575.1 Uncharacterised protein [[Eubacterium] contortum] [Faecalicatena contorta]